MSRLLHFMHIPALYVLLVVGAALGGSFFVGRLIPQANLGTREMAIFTLVTLTALLVLMPSERLLKLGMMLWVLTFGFGWRTVHVTLSFHVHPTEALVWLLFLLTLFRQLMQHRRGTLRIPLLIAVLALLAAVGMVTAVLMGSPHEAALNEFKIFITLVPAYYVVTWLVTSRAEWERAARLAVWVTAYVGCLGLIDYFAPDLSRSLVGREDVQTLYASTQGYSRVGFIFYGNFSAGFYIFTTFGLCVHYFLKSLTEGVVKLILNATVLLIALTAMALSGYRGLWYAVGVFLIAYSFVRFRGFVFLGGMVAAIPLLPSTFIRRFLSVLNTEYADSSQIKRIERATTAFNQMMQQPVTGWGWNGSGYVHSDLLQIGANLGLPALVIFVLWILSVLWRLARLLRRRDWIGPYAGALFATLCGILVLFGGEGILIFAQLLVPVWFTFAMAYKLVDLAAQGET